MKHLVPIIALLAITSVSAAGKDVLRVLSSLSKADLHEMLSKSVDGSGNECSSVTRSLIRGVNPYDDSLYISVACADGNELSIVIEALDKPVTVADCKILSLVNVNCWTTFDEAE